MSELREMIEAKTDDLELRKILGDIIDLCVGHPWQSSASHLADEIRETIYDWVGKENDS